MLLRRYIALSKLPLNSLAPVRKRLPMAAEVKSNVEDGGRARLRTSMLMRFRKDRISSFFADGMPRQIGDVPETISYHSDCASAEEVLLRRWLNRCAMAERSGEGGSVGMSRTRRPTWYQ